MKNRYFRLINISLILTALALAPYAAAGDDEEKENKATEKQASQAQQIEPMTVVDKPISMRQDLDPSSITNIYRVAKSAQFGIEVLNSEDIKNINPIDVNALLEYTSGFSITYQGRRNPYFYSQRGGGSFTYIIDGAVLPPSVNRILYKIPVDAIEEMQVVRGSTSLTLGPSVPIGASSSGSGVNTGFIIIRTKQPQKTQAILSGSLEKYSGDHPTATDASLYAGTKGETDSGTSGYAGILLSKMDKPSLDSWFDGRSGKAGMANTGFRTGKFNMNIMGYKDSGSFEMQRGTSDMKWYYDSLKIEMLSTDMGMQWTPDQITLLNLFKVNYDQHEMVESFSNSNSSSRAYEEGTEGIGLRHNARFGNTLVQVGGQISKSDGFGPNASTNYNKYDTSVKGWSASIEHTLLDGNLVFDGGYREDIKHIDNSSTSVAGNAANNNVDMAPSKILALGGHWQISNIYALDGRYFRGKQGTTGDFDMRLVGNATPHREKQDRFEAAISADYATWLKPVLTYFDIKADNAKSASSTTYVLDGGTYYYYTESDNLRKGVELLVKGNVFGNTSYNVSWTHMLNNENTNNGLTTDSIGKSNPENLYSMTVNHRWAHYMANVSIRKIDSWFDATSNTTELGGYTLIDANIKRDFKWQNLLLKLTLFAHNLTDKNYATMERTGFGPWMDRGRSVGIKASISY
jgi:hypothetical protein